MVTRLEITKREVVTPSRRRSLERAGKRWDWIHTL